MQNPFSTATALVSGIVTAAALLGSSGCHARNDPNSEAIATRTSAVVLERTHHEIIDPQDNLFITYWEKNYTYGTAAMDVLPNGYTTSVNYTSDANPGFTPNFVVGKGRNPCWGEQINWQISGTPVVHAIGVYGWHKEPLVEYYIGRGGGAAVGAPYSTSRGNYQLHVDARSGANIINPENSADLPQKFLQFNVQSLGGVPSTDGPVDLSQHFAAWEKLMAAWWPTQPEASQGWSWYPLATPNYCVVATEIYDAVMGSSNVSNISFEERITLDPIAQAVNQQGTEGIPLVYRVTASQPWTMEPGSIPAWVTISPTSGPAGITTVTATVPTPNPSTIAERRANIFLGMSGSDVVAGLQVIQFYDGEGRVAPGGGGGMPFELHRDGSWSAESSAPAWLSITPTSGTSGTYGMHMAATANTSGAARSASVTITGGGETKTIQVRQEPVFLFNDPRSFALAPAGETKSFNIHSDVIWWSAYTTNGGGWLTIAPGSYSGAGNGTVSFTASANNTGQARSATITIEGGGVPTRVVPITQGATPSPPCDPSNRLVNPGFESGTTGWTTWGATLSTTTLPVHTGAKSGRVTNRTSSWQGPVQDLIGKVTAGPTYRAEAWAKVSGFTNQPMTITLKSECVGSPPVYTPLDSATGNGWTHLSGLFTVPGCSLASLAIYIEGPAPGVTLYADDVSVAPICP